MLKSELFGDLRLDRPIDGEAYPDGYVFLPADTGDEWIKQLVAEQLISKRNKRTGRTNQEWQLTRPRNEALDNAIYARAIAISLGVDCWTDAKWNRQLGAVSRPGGPVRPPVEPDAPVAAGSAPPGRSKKINPFTGQARGGHFRRR